MNSRLKLYEKSPTLNRKVCISDFISMSHIALRISRLLKVVPLLCSCCIISRYENSLRHASGTNSRNMRNHNAEDHDFASFLIIVYIYDVIIALFLV